ncbi:MAG: L,D-transpeptidase [Synechococcus sp.]|nr:L,D-transpeptidase [Synechococcus sp.]
MPRPRCRLPWSASAAATGRRRWLPLALLLALAGLNPVCPPPGHAGEPAGAAAAQRADSPPSPLIPAANPPIAIGAAARPGNRMIVLELGRRRISLVENNQLLGRWPVAIGDPATPTPTGSFRVRNKVINPQYQSTRSGQLHPSIGPDGPLGDRWIGFHQQGPNQFGIHGTPPAWEWTVRSQAAVSHGCVRMLAPHVRLLFDQVEVGTPVLIRR